jgi:hypothetical protein
MVFGWLCQNHAADDGLIIYEILMVKHNWNFIGEEGVAMKILGLVSLKRTESTGFA